MDPALASKNEAEFRASSRNRQKQLEFTQRVLSLAASSGSTKAILNVDEDHALRRLYATEVQTLEKQCGCTCQDWSKLFLLVSTPSQATLDHSPRLRQLVSQTNFQGLVVLAVSNRHQQASPSLEPFSKLPLGIHNNLLIGPNSIVSTQSWVCRNTIISDTVIMPYSVVVGCGSLTASNNFGGQLKLTVGAESGGGRDLVVTPESDMMDICQQLTGRKTTAIVKDRSNPKTSYNVNVISSHCLVRDTPTLEGIYLDSGASVQAASFVANALLFPGAKIQNSCTCQDVRLQWDAAITDASNVSETLLMEQAHIGPNSLVASSILGPDVHVSAGEVHCSILGPNTNAHHQSLVISVLWPLGRGNVGYGANIGSNHTGRIPDQETSSGEGVFWGLSTVIKFPVDLTLAPYTIVAAGTTLPPQRVCMPFSLIVASNDGGSNNIIPGWVLSSSPYTIARSEKKYATRRKATRHKHYTGFKIVRPETIRMCQWARKQLQAGGKKAVVGIGSNVLSEKGRLSGIKAYTDCIQKFALGGLLEWLVAAQQKQQLEPLNAALQREFGSIQTGMEADATYEQVAWPVLPWEASQDLWQFQKQILLEEFPLKGDAGLWVSSLLETFVELEKAYAAKIYKCKKRDDQRGAQTVPGYAASHTAAENDAVVKEANARAAEVEKLVQGFLEGISKPQRSKL